MSFGFLTLWSGAAAGANGIATLIVFRFLAGLFGSSPLTNSGGVIADMFDSRQRALALSLFAAAPFLGPVIGPIVGGYVGQTIGWRWNEGVMCMFAGVMWIIGCLTLPETYAPILLRRRAERLCKATNSVYRTKMEIDEGKVSLRKEFSTALKRPWMLLFLEPIVLLLTIYLAILYGILYLNFSVYPVVYQKGYGFSPGEGGLAFIGIAIGMIGAVIYNIFENKRYIRISDAYTAKVELTPPEVRLFPAMVGAICLPIGLWWFAWTAQPSISPYVSIAAGIPFGGGLILVFISVFNYLIDSYTLYAASVLAANSILRSLFGCVFPRKSSTPLRERQPQRLTIHQYSHPTCTKTLASRGHPPSSLASQQAVPYSLSSSGSLAPPSAAAAASRRRPRA